MLFLYTSLRKTFQIISLPRDNNLRQIFSTSALLILSSFVETSSLILLVSSISFISGSEFSIVPQLKIIPLLNDPYNLLLATSFLLVCSSLLRFYSHRYYLQSAAFIGSSISRLVIESFLCTDLSQISYASESIAISRLKMVDEFTNGILVHLFSLFVSFSTLAIFFVFAIITSPAQSLFSLTLLSILFFVVSKSTSKLLRNASKKIGAIQEKVILDTRLATSGARVIQTERLADYVSGQIYQLELKKRMLYANCSLTSQIPKSLFDLIIVIFLLLSLYNISSDSNELVDATWFIAILIISQKLLPHLQAINTAFNSFRSNGYVIDGILDSFTLLPKSSELYIFDRESSRYVNSSLSSTYSSLRIDTLDPSRASNSILSVHKLFVNKFSQSNPISFEVYPGQTLLITGKSGVGKSTLLDIISGLKSPASGHVTLKNYIPRYNQSFSQGFLPAFVVYVPQKITLIGNTIKQSLTWPLSESEVSDDRVSYYMDLVDLDCDLDASVGEDGLLLSGGQRQRLALVRALLRGPEILLLDETFSGIDPDLSLKIISLMRSTHPDMAIILISHSTHLSRSIDCIYNIS